MIAVGNVGVEAAAVNEDRQEAGLPGALNIRTRLIAHVHRLVRAERHALEGGFKDKRGGFFASFAAGDAEFEGTDGSRGAG